LLRTDHLNTEEKSKLLNLCRKFNDIFYREGQALTFSNKIKHHIKTKDDLPIYTKSYRYPEVHRAEVQKQITEMLRDGVIRQSFSPWSSPIWIVPKKLDSSGKQKWRLVIDYRKLNQKTIDDRYPLPNITDILDKLGKSIYFSTIDLASGFHQIEINKKDIPKTAFSVESGHYEFIRMPFGLKNAPCTFQRVMDNVLRDFLGKFCLVYMDDIIVYSTSLQEHLENLTSVFTRLQEANFKIQLNKSEFLQKQVSFLGHIVSSDGVRPNPDKIRAIKQFPIPKTAKQIKTFLGLLGYYRKFIQDFSKLTKPLTECLRKGNKIIIDSKYKECFEMCKNILCNDPVLQYPDFSKEFILTTDASNVALGAILSQGPIGSDKPICYASRTLNKTEQNYSTIEKELLGIVWATKYFRPYLFGRKFKVITDHKPLTWLFSLKEPNSKLVRWRLKLEEFDYEVIYKKGKENSNVDALSRVELHANEALPNIDNLDISTVHSAEEDFESGIHISERPLNEFSNQLILTKTDSTQIKKQTKILFKKKHRVTVFHNFSNINSLIDIITDHLNTKRVTAVLTDDNTFKIFQTAFSKFFADKGLKVVRSMSLLEDVTELDIQEHIINNYHSKSNHRGINETHNHLKREYYFPKMLQLITRIINKCEVCLKNKYERSPEKTKFELTETPSKPLEIVHIDIYFVHKEIFLTVIDKFSKFASAYLLKTRNSLHIIQSLKHFFSHHGIPKLIISDNGLEFSSSLFKQFLELYNISHHLTSIKNSTGNSPVERLHSTLTEIIRIIQAQNKEKPISETMDEAILTYNNSIHTATKLTPFEAINGHFHSKNPFQFKTIPSSTEDYLKSHIEQYSKLSKLIQDRVQLNKEKTIQKANENRKEPEKFDENCSVFVSDNRRNKLAPKFVKNKVVKDNKITVQTKNSKVHKRKIRPIRKT